MTNKEAIEWLEKEIKFRHNLKVSPLLAGKQDTEEEVHRAAIEALKFQEEYMAKAQKCIDKINARMWIFTEDINPAEIIGIQWANEMNLWCREIIQEELWVRNE